MWIIQDLTKPTPSFRVIASMYVGCTVTSLAWSPRTVSPSVSSTDWLLEYVNSWSCDFRHRTDYLYFSTFGILFLIDLLLPDQTTISASSFIVLRLMKSTVEDPKSGSSEVVSVAIMAASTISVFAVLKPTKRT